MNRNTLIKPRNRWITKNSVGIGIILLQLITLVFLVSFFRLDFKLKTNSLNLIKAEKIKHQLIVNEMVYRDALDHSDVQIIQNASCVQERSCKLPNCLCFGVDDCPAHLTRDQVPQIVIFAADGELTDEYGSFYDQIFKKHKNPNGCPFKGSLFLADKGMVFLNRSRYFTNKEPLRSATDFEIVREFYNKGWEIGIQGSDDSEHTNNNSMAQDVVDMLVKIQRETNIPYSIIRGYKPPYARPLVSSEIRRLEDLGFFYSMSFTTTQRTWPFTLDYGFKSSWDNLIVNLPSTPGFWLIPNSHYDARPFKTSQLTYVDDIAADWNDQEKLNTASEIETILNAAFNKHYTSNRSPFTINIHGSLFRRNKAALPSMVKFFDRLATLGDVYVVNAYQALQWLKNPVPLNDLRTFGPWKCQ